MSGDFPEDTRALDAWAGARIEGWRGPSAAKKFAAGQSNPTYLIETANGRYVLRVALRDQPSPLDMLFVARAGSVDGSLVVLRVD